MKIHVQPIWWVCKKRKAFRCKGLRQWFTLVERRCIQNKQYKLIILGNVWLVNQAQCISVICFSVCKNSYSKTAYYKRYRRTKILPTVIGQYDGLSNCCNACCCEHKYSKVFIYLHCTFGPVSVNIRYCVFGPNKSIPQHVLWSHFLFCFIAYAALRLQ